MNIIVTMHFTKVIFIIFVIFPGSPAYGLTLEEKLIEENKEISKHIDSLARSLDGLLSNRRAIGLNRSSVSLLGFVESKEGEVINEKGHVELNLRLPEFEEKWKLRFSTFDKEDEFEGLSRNRDGAGPRQQKAGTSFGASSKIANIRTTFRPRIELKDPLVSSLLLKFNSTIPFVAMNINWEKKFFAHSIDGVGQAARLDFNFNLTQKLVLRIFNEEQYLDRDNFFAISQGPSLLYKINDKIGISQTISFNSQNRNLTAPLTPSSAHKYGANNYHLNSYNFIFSFSHRLYKNIFHYQITPFLNFEKQKNFKGAAGATLRTELIF